MNFGRQWSAVLGTRVVTFRYVSLAFLARHKRPALLALMLVLLAGLAFGAGTLVGNRVQGASAAPQRETIANACADVDGDGQREFVASVNYTGPEKWGWYVQILNPQTGNVKREIADARLLGLIDFHGSGIPSLVVQRTGEKPPVIGPTPTLCACAKPGAALVGELGVGSFDQDGRLIGVLTLTESRITEARLGSYQLETVPAPVSATQGSDATCKLRGYTIRPEVPRVEKGVDGLIELAGRNVYTGHRDVFGLAKNGLIELLER